MNEVRIHFLKQSALAFAVIQEPKDVGDKSGVPQKKKREREDSNGWKGQNLRKNACTAMLTKSSNLVIHLDVGSVILLKPA